MFYETFVKSQFFCCFEEDYWVLPLNCHWRRIVEHDDFWLIIRKPYEPISIGYEIRETLKEEKILESEKFYRKLEFNKKKKRW